MNADHEVSEALDWLVQVHDSDPSARRLAIVSEHLDRRDAEIERLTRLADRLADRIERVRAIVNPRCTCPGACSDPPRKVRTDEIKAALDGGGAA